MNEIKSILPVKIGGVAEITRFNALLHGVFKVRNNLQLLENEAFRLSRSPPWQNAS